MGNNHHATVVKRVRNLGLQAKDGVQVLTGEHFVCFALGDDGAVLHSDEVISDSGGEVQLVQHMIMVVPRCSLRSESRSSSST